MHPAPSFRLAAPLIVACTLVASIGLAPAAMRTLTFGERVTARDAIGRVHYSRPAALPIAVDGSNLIGGITGRKAACGSYRAAPLAAVTDRVKVPMVAGFPFGHLA